MRALVLIACAFFALIAPAARAALPYSPEWSWTWPTKNVDGSNIPATGPAALKEIRFYCAQAPAAPTKTSTPVKVVAFPATSWTQPVGTLTTGNWSCAVSAVNNAGDESALTTALPFTLANPPPAPPSALIVQ